MEAALKALFASLCKKNVISPPLSSILGVDLSIHFRYTDFQQHYVTVFYQARIIVEKVGIQ